MKIAIIAAMSKELALLLPLIDAPSVVTANGITFNRGNIGRHEVIASECGIGKVNAAVGTLTLIECFHPDIIINTGVAGGTGNGASILDVIIADRIAYHDVWCGPGTERGQAAGFPARFECPLPLEIRRSLGAREGLLASGDIFVDDPADLQRILALYPDAIAVDMESAAIAQVCALKDVPFVCLRVVSDTPGEGGNMAAYTDFWSAAPERTFESVGRLLQLL